MAAKYKTENGCRYPKIPQLQAKITDLDARQAIAHDVGCAPHYLYMLATGRRRASGDMATAIARRIRVRRSVIRADLFA